MPSHAGIFLPQTTVAGKQNEVSVGFEQGCGVGARRIGKFWRPAHISPTSPEIQTI